MWVVPGRSREVALDWKMPPSTQGHAKTDWGTGRFGTAYTGAEKFIAVAGLPMSGLASRAVSGCKFQRHSMSLSIDV